MIDAINGSKCYKMCVEITVNITSLNTLDLCDDIIIRQFSAWQVDFFFLITSFDQKL